MIIETVTAFSEASKKNAALFISAVPDVVTCNFSQSVRFLTNAKRKLDGLNISNSVGLYINVLLDDYELQLKAVEEVFGEKMHSVIKIGQIMNCKQIFSIHEALAYLKRLDFITCKIRQYKHMLPEESVENFISSCKEHFEAAQNLNISAKIMCTIDYASKGKINVDFSYAKVGLDLDFVRFWCGVVHKLSNDPRSSAFIMQSVANNKIYNNLLPMDRLYLGYYNTGWWRRTHLTSIEPGAFVEKVDEIPIGRVSGNCSKICQSCSSSADCCIGLCQMEFNNTLQFANSSSLHRRICKEPKTLCDNASSSVDDNMPPAYAIDVN